MSVEVCPHGYHKSVLRHCAECEHGREIAELEAENARLRQAVSRLRSAMKPLFDLACEDADGMDHDDDECPMDDSCRCENVARVNAVLRAADEALKATRQP
jgi:hypothetical protein